MNHRLIFRVIGIVLRLEALLMTVPLLVSLIYQGNDHWAFIQAILLTGSLSLLLSLIKPKSQTFRIKDAFLVAGLSWLALSLCGALPYYFSGYFPNFTDCLFESISGFTTTGSTILTNVEIIPRGILFWRSFTHWVGGMGVLMFMMAIMPSMSASSLNLLKAESTGPIPDKVVPKIRETAQILYKIYFVLTVTLIVLLLFTGMPLYDALVNSFSVAGTGGFGVYNTSIAAYKSVAAEMTISVFMFLFGVNFSLYFFLFNRQFRKFLKDSELKFYFWFVLAAIVAIAFNILPQYGEFFSAFRYSIFQVTSIISTTGFTTANFDLWPAFSKVILVVLMVCGCCGGSTGGGLKLIRIVVLLKAVKIEINRILHPQSVKNVNVGERTFDQQLVNKTAIFVFVYFMIFVGALLLVSLEGKDILSGGTAVISALSNIGPGLGLVGPVNNFEHFTVFSKLVLSFCMIAGRLEFFPVIFLFIPAVWKRPNLRRQ